MAIILVFGYISYNDFYFCNHLFMLEFVKSANPSLFAKYPYLFLPAVVSVGFYLTIHCEMAYTVVFFIYGIITMMDQITMKDWVNPNLREIK